MRSAFRTVFGRLCAPCVRTARRPGVSKCSLGMLDTVPTGTHAIVALAARFGAARSKRVGTRLGWRSNFDFWLSFACTVCDHSLCTVVSLCDCSRRCCGIDRLPANCLVFDSLTGHPSLCAYTALPLRLTVHHITCLRTACSLWCSAFQIVLSELLSALSRPVFSCLRAAGAAVAQLNDATLSGNRCHALECRVSATARLRTAPG